MALADARGRFLYEIMAERFPYDYLTTLEISLWARFYDDRSKRLKQKSS